MKFKLIIKKLRKKLQLPKKLKITKKYSHSFSSYNKIIYKFDIDFYIQSF